MAELDTHSKVVRLSRNYGHQAALLAGYQYASGDVVVTLDAGLQDPPELIGTMLERVREGYDVVYATRESRQQDTWFKRWTADGFYRLMEKFGAEVIPHHAEYRMVTRQVLEGFLEFEERNLFIRATFPLVGFRSCTVHYERPDRAAGETKYPFHMMLDFAINGITSFSVVPLRLCSLVGIGVSGLAILLLLWSLITKLTGGALPGWTSTVAPLYFLGGVQLIFLGVVGEYIGRIYIEVKRHPRFIVAETLNFEQASLPR